MRRSRSSVHRRSIDSVSHIDDAVRFDRVSALDGVCLDLRRRLRGRQFEVVLFAGQTYADPIERCMALLDRSVAVTTPLSGLSLGYQLRWFRIAAQLRKEGPHVAG